MGGSNGGSFSDGDSTEVPLNNKRDINDNLMLGSPELEAENVNAKSFKSFSNFKCKCLCPCSDLYLHAGHSSINTG
jgi:hypothetical protein